jgi:hypothetical protein
MKLNRSVMTLLPAMLAASLACATPARRIRAGENIGGRK